MKKLKYLLLLLIIASMALVACGTGAEEAPVAEEEAPAAEEEAPVAEEEAPAAEEEAPAAEAPGELLFVAINKSADQQYFIDLQNAFVETTEGTGAQALKFDAKLDPSLGVSLVNDAISAGAKGIAITVPDQTIGPAIAQAAKEAGVVLIATDDGIVDENGDPVPFVGFDGKDMGKKVGEAAAELLTESGWLDDGDKKVGVLSVEVQTLSVCNDRTDNEKAAAIAAGVPEDQVFPVPYTGETLSAQDAAGPIITANPDITNWVVFGCNDEGVLGTLNALATTGYSPDDIIGVGLGAYEACKFWAADQPSGFKAGLFISGLDVGNTAATVLYDAVVNGVEPPENSFAPTTIVDQTNYESVMDAISLANCGTEPAEAPAAEAPGELLFVAINKSADQQYFIDLQNAFVETTEGTGAQALKFDAKLDPSLGVSLVNDAISAGAKGIAITVPDQTIGPAIAQAAKEAGVVLIATDDGIVDENGDPVPFVGFDGKDMGKKVGEAAAELLTESGWLDDGDKKVGVLSVEVQTLSVCNDRTDNEKAAAIAAGVPEDQVFPVPYTGETLSAQDAAGPIITANPDITNWVVFGCNDEGVLGTLNALATTGYSPDDIIGVGLGAYEACKFWAADQPSGFKAGLFISGLDVGNTAATVLYDAVVNGVEPPENSFAPTTIVDPDNYTDVMDEISLGNCSQ
jgi:L-arabinose transport system substrate-binding protein